MAETQEQETKLRWFHVSKRSLVEATTFEEIEPQLADDHSRFAPECEAFKAEMVGGGELRTWRTPLESWKQRRGRSGYVSVRNGKLTEHFLITVMN